MARRWNAKTRKRVYAALVRRDGEFCELCKSHPPHVRLEIDHVHGTEDSRLASLRLLCVACNRSQGNRRRRSERVPKQPFRKGESGTAKQVPSDFSQRINEKESPDFMVPDRTSEVREIVDFQAGSPEMAANDLYEPYFRGWLLSELCTGRQLTKKEAIYEGAEVCGCNPKTTRDYLDKMTSRAGPVREARDSNGMKIIVLRSPDVQR